jgi:hypothetical protein
MSTTTGANKLSDLPVAEAALLELCKPFVHHPAEFKPEVVVVQPDEIPYPQDQLLVHHAHMTEVLQRHHGAPVNVHVLEEHNGGPLYTRKISLTPVGRDDKVVEWGIVRLDFRYMAAEVRDEILAKKLPLGAVLIKHDVLRRIKPRWFIRCPSTGPLLRLFGRPSTPEEAYGRIGTIYCNDEPAIELIEIVLNCDNGLPKKTNGHAI